MDPASRRQFLTTPRFINMYSRRTLLSCGILLLAATAVVADSACNWSRWYYAKAHFNVISEQVVLHDYDIHETCKHFKNFTARAEFGYNNYHIEVDAPGMENGVWDVKIRHRVIYINGHLERTEECDLTYADIKILPNFVNVKQAAWKYEDGVFTLGIPYFDMDEIQYLCKERAIDEKIFNVRKGAHSDEVFK